MKLTARPLGRSLAATLLLAALVAALGACSSETVDDGQGGAGGGGSSGDADDSSSGGNGSGGAATSLVQPIERDGKLVFEFGSTFFEVDPAVGGRITALRLGDSSVLTGADVNAANWGSTFWTSPQSDWGWPPPVAIDNGPYTSTVSGKTMTLVGSAATVGAKTLSVTKTFTADLANEALTLVYTIKNEGAEAVSVAPWEISRVAGGGLSFFPTGDAAFTPAGSEALTVTSALDVTWFDSAANPPDDVGHKLNADGKDGWLAHVVGDVLFLKQFADLPVASQASGEGEVEIYAAPSGDGGYIELEVQGAYAEIAAGATVDYTVTWLVRKLPDGVSVEAGSAELLDFVESLL